MRQMTKYEREVYLAERAAVLRKGGHLWGLLHADDPGRGTQPQGG